MIHLLVAASLLVAAPAPDGNPAAGTPIAGFGVASPDRKLVFLPAKGGGVEAVDLASGKPLWVNKDAGKLAGASEKLVFALAGDEKKPNAFRVFAFDAASGKTVGKSDPIAMADWATTARVGGRSFRAAARAEGDGVAVAWQARAFYFGGAAPSPEILKAAMKEDGALVTVDFKSGKLTPATAKPKEADFNAGTGGEFQNKLGDYEFQVQEEIPGFKPGAPLVTKVTLTVLKGGKTAWTRELAGNPWSPPPP